MELEDISYDDLSKDEAVALIYYDEKLRGKQQFAF